MAEQEILSGGTVVFTDAVHRVTGDALVLAVFCTPKPAAAVCELGSGCGTVLLALADGGHRGPALGLELDAAGTALLQQAIEANGFAQMQALCADVRHYKSARLFDDVVANPPYFCNGKQAQSAARATARHEGSCTITEACAAAGRLLKDGGSFWLCWPPARLQSLFEALAAARLAPRRLQLLRKSPAHAPRLALVQARKNRGEGLTILPDRLDKME